MGDVSKIFCGLKFSTTCKDEDLHKVNGAIIELELRNKELEQEVRELKKERYESNMSLGGRIQSLNKEIESLKACNSANAMAPHLLDEFERKIKIKVLEKTVANAKEFDYIIRVEIKFERIASHFDAIREYIRKLVKDVPMKSEIYKIRGKLESGEEIGLAIGDNLEDFGKLQFDKYVELLPSESWNDYKNSEAIKKLIYLVQSKSVVFGQIILEDSWRLESAATFNSDLEKAS